MFLAILNIIFVLAFLVFAWFNINDKDSWLWVPIYVSAAILCGLAAFGKYFPSLYLVAVTCYLLYAIILFFAKDGVRDWLMKYHRQSIVESMQATKPYIEKTREFFGLLIISTALLVDYFAVT
jgi:hypothetical protein